MASFDLTGTSFEQIDRMLARAPLAVRGKALKASMRKQANEFNKEYRRQLPRGMPKDTPHIKQLHKVVGQKTVEKPAGVFITIAGVKTNKEGQGWYVNLVEYDYTHAKTKARIPGKASLAKAANKVQSITEQEMRATIENEIIKAGG